MSALLKLSSTPLCAIGFTCFSLSSPMVENDAAGRKELSLIIAIPSNVTRAFFYNIIIEL